MLAFIIQGPKAGPRRGSSRRPESACLGNTQLCHAERVGIVYLMDKGIIEWRVGGEGLERRQELLLPPWGWELGVGGACLLERQGT